MNFNFSAKTGVLLVNLGTPDDTSVSSVRRYLKQFLMDARVIDYSYIARTLLVKGIIVPKRAANSANSYRKIWNEKGSPIKYYGFEVTRKLQQLLGEEYCVELAMRYQNPSIEAGLEKLYSQNVSKIVVLTLFPQYASATVGSVHEEVMRIVMKKQIIPNISFINSYPDYKPVIDVFVKNALQFDLNKYDHFIFSFHGLPVRQLFKADHNNVCKKDASCCDTCTSANQFCYKAQCFRTARAIAQGLKLDSNKYTICFQSRLGREEWITPYTSTVLKDRAAAGDKHLLVFSPSFVADCLETLVEIADEYQEEFIHLGGKSLDLVPSLNDDDIWISGLAALINNNH